MRNSTSLGETRWRPMIWMRRAAGVFGFAVIGFAAFTTVAFPDQAGDVAPIGVLVGTGVSGGLILRGARKHVDREQLAWRLIGFGLLLGCAGVLLVGVLSTLAPVPTFGPTDLIFMTTYGFLMTGFALMPHLGPQFGSRVRVILDGLIGAAGMVAVVGVFFLSAHLDDLATATFWERFAGVMYPILDVAAVVVALIVTIRRSGWRFDPRIAFFGMGMVMQAFGDLSLLSSGVGQSFADAKPNFLYFLAAQACYLAVAVLINYRPAPREYADRRQAIWPLLAPYGVAGLVTLLGIQALQRAGLPTSTRLLLLNGLIVVILVLVRQAFALREYRTLVEDRRRALVASVSHELRTPLTAMVGFLDVMKDPDMVMADEERRELTAVVHQQAVYMSRIVSDLLLLARDSDGPELHESVVSVDKVVADSVWSGRSSPAGLEVEIEPGLFAYLDPDRIRQVLDNLVTNGMRYGRGQVLITVSSRDQDLIFEVHDDGAGVPRKYEVVIWEQFERGPNRLNSNVPGSGIGLAVVDRIVRRHHGTAAYERSRRLGGACFRVVLPGRLRPAPRQLQGEGLRASVQAR